MALAFLKKLARRFHRKLVQKREQRRVRLALETLEDRYCPDASVTSVVASPATSHFTQSVLLEATVAPVVGSGDADRQRRFLRGRRLLR